MFNYSNALEEWNWSDQSSNFGTGLDADFVTGVSFICETTGWICTSGGSIWKTTDSGENWTEQTLPQATPPDEYLFGFKGISMYSTTDGWAFGNYGISPFCNHSVIIQYDGDWENGIPHYAGLADRYWAMYTKGGQTDVFLGTYNTSNETLWIRVLSGTYTWNCVNPTTRQTTDIKDIDFCEVNTDLGWATGNSATFYTESGCESTWSRHGDTYYGITCIDSDGLVAMAWSIGTDGDIYHTYKDGNSWYAWTEDFEPDNTVHAICSVGNLDNDDILVVAAGNLGSLYYLDVSSDYDPPVIVAGLEEPINLRVSSVCRDAIVVDIDLPEAEEADLCIYDISGRLATSSNLGRVRNGSCTYTVNCRDSSGDYLPVGVYFCVLETDTQIATASFVIIS